MVKIKGKNNTLKRTLMHIMIIFSLLIIMKLLKLEELYVKTVVFILNIVLSIKWLSLVTVWLLNCVDVMQVSIESIM